jgi:hypothetical protein
MHEESCTEFIILIPLSLEKPMLSGPLVTTAWRFLRLRMEGISKYIEYVIADSRQGFGLGVGRGANNSSP